MIEFLDNTDIWLVAKEETYLNLFDFNWKLYLEVLIKQKYLL